jgi:lipoate-protein ligase A
MSSGYRVIDSGPQSASLNMATDEAIFLGFTSGASPPTLRFCSFDPPAITLGIFQKPSESLCSEAQECGLSVVRRPTGGRAVVHAGDLTYSVVASTSDPDLGGGVMETYCKISQRLVNGLKELGVEAAIESCEAGQRYERSASCFDSGVVHELKCGKEKIAGSAQVRQSGAFLQQGSIPLVRPQFDFERLFGPGSRPPAGLASILGRQVTYEEVRSAIQNCFGCAMRVGSLQEFELSAREELIGKYESSQWNRSGENPDKRTACVLQRPWQQKN